MSIERIQFTNYRRFEKFDISFRKNNVIVGPNNSGKSSILDALRMLNAILKIATRKNPHIASQGSDGVCSTYDLAHSAMAVPLPNITRNYSEDFAEVTFLHENKNEIKLFLHPDRSVKCYLVSPNDLPRSSMMFRRAFPIDLVIVPTLAPIEEEEPYLAEETVRRNEATRLASRNFRNIWLRRDQGDFERLREILITSWPGLDIRKPEIVHGPSSYVTMFYSEDRMERELYWSGFGLQVWLQMITHLLRGKRHSTIVLDEPDIYLHPDLQRKLLHLVKDSFKQSILATHSVEIINESSPGDVISVNPNHRRARRVSSEDDYKSVFAYLGSAENVDFARLARAKRIIFFEGSDRRLFRQLASRLGKVRILDDPDTTFLKAGGFGQWRRVKGVEWTLQEVLKMDVNIYSIFDRDYRSDPEVEDFRSKIESEGVRCRVLSRKEIENYLLEPGLLGRVLTAKKTRSGIGIGIDEFHAVLSETIDSFEDDVRSSRTANYVRYQRGLRRGEDDTTLHREANKAFKEVWTDPSTKLKYLSGKECIAHLSTLCQSRYGFSVTPSELAKALRVEEIDQEIVAILEEIEDMVS